MKKIISCGTCERATARRDGCLPHECLVGPFPGTLAEGAGLDYAYELYVPNLEAVNWALVKKTAILEATNQYDEPELDPDPSECDLESCDTCDMGCGPATGELFAEAYDNFSEDTHDGHLEAELDEDLNGPSEEYAEFEKDYDALAEEDVVLHPNHYAEADIPSGIECWDWYELAMSEAEVTGHFKGNILKYVFRAGRKGDAIQDLEKARNYLARWIGYLKGDRTVHMRGKKNDG